MRIVFAEIDAAKELPKDKNTLIDIFQAIAPAAYCTYVLVDGQWDARIRAAKKRMSEAGLTSKVATTYSMRGDGLELFLQDIESYGAAAPAA